MKSGESEKVNAMLDYETFWNLCEQLCEPGNTTRAYWLDIPHDEPFLLTPNNGRFGNRINCYLKYKRAYKAALEKEC